jgi:hypothetical protein
MYAWNQLGRRINKGEKGIRILAPMIGIRRKKDSEAEKDITKQNQPVLVGFRTACRLEGVADRCMLLLQRRNSRRDTIMNKDWNMLLVHGAFHGCLGLCSNGHAQGGDENRCLHSLFLSVVGRSLDLAMSRFHLLQALSPFKGGRRGSARQLDVGQG